MPRTISLAIGLSIAITTTAAFASNPATIKEYEEVFTTYPYADPDPVPTMGRIYPYFRYDGFTNEPVQQEWKVVALENDYLRILILPQIGGKVWATIEKSTGKSFVYFNHVVKFRDVAMRGPWTSGGMEANYGIIGHTPNCASPVDYLTRINPDGSASCFIGGLDLITRTNWRVEIRLPADQACLITKSIWHNPTPFEQSSYSWMNVGIKSAGKLEFVNPGTNYIYHDGKDYDWPVNKDNDHAISWYDSNDFGGPKSYHVLGRLSEFFGGYWHDDDFGMAHWAPYGDKPGRKVWIWGLARDGMIWENLLTDHDGQYVEVQSGRLYNQADSSSTLTPFKHREFSPHGTDTWTEYWMPVKGTKGFKVVSPSGTMNVTREEDRVIVRVCPTRAFLGTLEVLDGEKVVASRELNLTPMQPHEEVLKVDVPREQLRVRLRGAGLEYSEGQEDVLTRPLESPQDFDWSTAQGHSIKGKEHARQRDFARAEKEFQASLQVDPHDLPSLVELAALANLRGDAEKAAGFARHALSIDTYDPGANFQFGLACVALGKTADARAAFSIAGLTGSYRSAANFELAKLCFRSGELDRAQTYAEESLAYDKRQQDALGLLACMARAQKDVPAAEKAIAQLLDLDPLSHLARAERFLLGKADGKSVQNLIRNDLPHETYLELAAWYRGIGRDEDAVKVLELSPPTAEVLYWIAYLHKDTSLLAKAEAASPAFVFPFRTEAVPVFEWVMKQSDAWQPRYFLALIRWYQRNEAQARELLDSCGEKPHFAPFYAVRAQLNDQTAEKDLRRAIELDPAQWHFGLMLARLELQYGAKSTSLDVASNFARRFPNNSALAIEHVKALMANDRFEDAAARLDTLTLLPAEGTSEARALYREAHLMVAVSLMGKRDFAAALKHVESARQWPERLGTGKPYQKDIDERLEDWLAYKSLLATKATDEARAALKRILDFQPNVKQGASGELLRALALLASGQVDQADAIQRSWLEVNKSDPTTRLCLGIYVRHHLPSSAPRAQGPSPSHDVNLRILAAWDYLD